MFLAGYGTDNLLHYSYLKKWVKLDRITGYVGMDNVVVVEHSERKERRKKNYCILYICILLGEGYDYMYYFVLRVPTLMIVDTKYLLIYCY